MSHSCPLVSVVTPVYNGGAYLAGCIESVLAQTYENWEYVIVNNCSFDRSLKIAQDYAEKIQEPRCVQLESWTLSKMEGAAYSFPARTPLGWLNLHPADDL